MADVTFLLDDPDTDVISRKSKVVNEKEKDEVDHIDIDEFLVKGGECGCYQIMVQTCLAFILIPLVFPILLFYFIGYDPPWICEDNNIAHSEHFQKICNFSNKTFAHDDSRRCMLNRSEWTYKYSKQTIVTDFDLVCDRNWLNALSGSIVFIGWGIGIIISGYFSDNYGRKRTMFIVFFLSTILLFLCALVNEIWHLIVIRFFMGLFFAAPALNTYVMLVEIVGPNRRVMATTISHICSIFAALVMTLKAKLIDNWRTLTILCSLPYLIGIVAVFFVPESVRWLNLKGRTREAEAILRKAAKYNKRMLPAVTLKCLDSDKEHGKKATYIDIFKNWKITKSMLAQGFIWFQCGMTAYALSWAFADLGGDMYVNFILSLLTEIIGHLVVWFLLQRVGRKKTCIWSSIGAALSCFIVACIPKLEQFQVHRLIFGLIGKFMISNVFTVMYIWSSEIYPTVLRTQGMGINIVTSRAGAATSPFIKILDQLHSAAPFLLMGICAVIATALSFTLPETRNKATRETLDDMLVDGIEMRVLKSINNDVKECSSFLNDEDEDGAEEADSLLQKV